MESKLIASLIVIALLCGLGGCANTSSVGEHFTMTGTPEGIRAYNDGLVGALKTAKEKPDAHNQYFASRKDYEENVTARELHKPKGFIQQLFDRDETTSDTITPEKSS